MNILRSSTTVIFLSVMVGAPALAQVLDEIVITASKREQNLQDSSLAISAVSAEQMGLLNINDAAGLEQLVPGFVWGDSGRNAWPSIRGINTPSQEINVDPSIAFFIDGIYRSRTRQAMFGFIDMERVEVLRGPQGTLSGRNSTGGAVNIFTRKPTEELEGGIEVTAGNFSLVKATGILNVPFSDTIQGRFVLSSEQMDGYVNNVGPGEDVMDRDLLYGRASFRFVPNDNTEIIARFAGSNSDRVGGGPFAYKRLGLSYIAYDDSTAGRSIIGDPLFVNVRATPSDGIPDFTTPDGTQIDVGYPVNPDPWTIDTDHPDSDKTDFTEASIEARFDFDSVTLKYYGGYSTMDSFPEDDLDKTSTLTTGVSTNQFVSLSQDTKTTTHEIQLMSNTDSDLEWVLGAFYLKDDLFENFVVGVPPVVVDRKAQVDVDGLAFFGQATWSVSDDFRLTVGGRYTDDEKDFLQTDRGSLTADIPGVTFDEFTWRLAADYRVSEDVLLYASVATGFRSGGFTRSIDDPATPDDDESIVESETNISYEIGIKSELLDNRWRLNLTAYFMEIEDQQVSTITVIAGTPTGQSALDNAGETTAYGIEAELQAIWSEGWFMYGTLAYNDAEYDEFFTDGFSAFDGNPDFDDLLDGVLDGGTQLAGNKPPRSPELTLAVTLGRDIELAAGVLTPVVTVQYSDEYYNNFFNTAIERQDSYTKVGARVMFASESGKWGLSVYGENLTDEAVQIRGTHGARKDYFVAYAIPRNYGVKFNLNF